MAYLPNNQTIFGYRYSATTWSNLTDFVQSGATVNVVSNKLQFSGGVSDFNQSLDIISQTVLEKFRTTIQFSVSITGTGVGIGIRSTNISTPSHVVAGLNTSTGFLSIYVAGTPTLVSTSLSAITFNSTDVIELSLIQDGFNLFASARNVTTSATGSTGVTCQYVYNTKPNTLVQAMANTGRMAIWNFGGTFTVSSIEWASLTPKGATVMVIGDSKAKGNYVTGFGNRFGDLLNSDYTPTVINSGIGDATPDVLNRINEIIGLAPKNAFLAIGRNDIARSTAFSAYTSNYNSIVNQLTSAGIQVYHLVGFWETSLDQTPLVNYILSSYTPTTIINCYTATTQGGFLFTDGIHLNDAGNRTIYNAIIKANKIQGTSYTEQNVIRNQNSYIQSGGFSINGTGTFNGAGSGLEVLNQLVFAASATSLVNLSSTWNTSGAPTAIQLNVTDTSSSASSQLLNIGINGNLRASLDKNGKFKISGATNGVQQTIQIPSAQTVSNAIFQIVDSGGTAIFALNTNGAHNTFVGVMAGVNCVTPSGSFGNGNNNTAVGWRTLNATTSGSALTAIGGEALIVNTTGANNTAVGQRAMFTNTTGSANVGIGQAAMFSFSGGSNNVGIGSNALKGNNGATTGATGSDNIGIGTNAMQANSVGNQNIAIGTLSLAALTANTDVSQSIAIGYHALRNGTVGLNNIAIGWQVGDNSTLGNSNIMIGANQTTTSSITNTTLIGTTMNGSLSNVVAISRADQNVLIGQTNVITDNGAKLQISGDVTTSDPNSGIGKWKLGKVLSGATVHNTSTYVEVNIDGVIVKLAMAL